jgi:hypothetical protein
MRQTYEAAGITPEQRYAFISKHTGQVYKIVDVHPESYFAKYTKELVGQLVYIETPYLEINSIPDHVSVTCKICSKLAHTIFPTNWHTTMTIYRIKYELCDRKTTNKFLNQLVKEGVLYE